MFRLRRLGKETVSSTPPSWVTLPAITFAQVASPITYSPGSVTGNPLPVRTYSLWVGGINVGLNYLPIEADAGKSVEVRASASNGFGGVVSSTSQSATISPQSASIPSWGAPPTVTRAQVGATLTYSLGSVYGYPTPTTSYVLQLDGVTIAANYVVTSDDVGKVVTVTGSAVNASGTTTSTSAPVSVVAVLYAPNLPVNLRLVSANGNSFTVTCDPGAIDTTHGATTGYEFQQAPGGTLDFTASSGVIATNSYTFTGLTANTLYEARVRSSNGTGTTGWITLGTVWTEPAAGAARIMWLQRRDINNSPITTDTFCIYGSQDELAEPTLLYTLQAGVPGYSQLPARTEDIVYYKDIYGLVVGTWYFSISTIDASGNESDRSIAEERTLS